jgi:hypothetical protein
MVAATSRNAEGCVVVDRARRSLADSLSERLRQRAPSLAIYAAMIREISSLYGWMVTVVHERDKNSVIGGVAYMVGKF